MSKSRATNCHAPIFGDLYESRCQPVKRSALDLLRWRLGSTERLQHWQSVERGGFYRRVEVTWQGRDYVGAGQTWAESYEALWRALPSKPWVTDECEITVNCVARTDWCIATLRSDTGEWVCEGPDALAQVLKLLRCYKRAITPRAWGQGGSDA